MKVNVKKELIGYDGKPIAKIKEVLINILNFENHGQNGQPRITMSAEDKLRAYELSLLITKNDEVDLNEKDIVRIKEVASVVYPPVIFGQIERLLRV